MANRFEVLDASIDQEKESWIQLWEQWTGREVQAHPAYVELFAGPDDRALAATYLTDQGARVLYPFLLRRIVGDNQDAFDITSPYGYGGAFNWGQIDKANDPGIFWTLFGQWAEKQNVVSEFIRFAIFPEDLLPYPGQVIQRQDNIVVDLDQSDDSMWRSFDRKVRKNVNRAKKEHVEVGAYVNERGFDDFYPIYVKTMERRGASESYFFPPEFFHAIHSGLAGSYAYFHARIGKTVVSTELVLVSDDAVYSFLGGTHEEHFAARPNDLLKFEIMGWAKKHGKSSFVLGGGYTAGDGIERYKKAFAPEGNIPFYTGQRILDTKSYAVLSQSQVSEEVQDESDFFPAYRR